MSAADSMMNAMNATDKSSQPVVIFKSTRLVQSQTTQLVRAGNLNFQVIHRFGDIAGLNGGGQTAFGIDRVNDVYIGFQYGISDNVNVDLGRSTIGELVQLDLKYALPSLKPASASRAICRLPGSLPMTKVRPKSASHAAKIGPRST